jgi:hypothetical protein
MKIGVGRAINKEGVVGRGLSEIPMPERVFIVCVKSSVDD